MKTLTSFESPREALEALLARVKPLPREVVSADRAAGRILADPVVMDRPSPAVSVSAMDGFAARAADVRTHGRLPIVGEVRIGREPMAMPGTPGVVRIVTGGAVPLGADVVIKREDVLEGEGEVEVEVGARANVREGEHIRRMGENGPEGRVIAEPGRMISAALAGALASVGMVHVGVFAKATVAVISTGDELVDVWERPTPWQLRDSNGPGLAGMFAAAPWVGEVVRYRAADDEAAMDKALGQALAKADAVLLSGGVSAGHRDFVPGALARAGIETVFHKLPQRPGRPVLGAVTENGRPVLALPGNPVSVLVTARRLAWPAIARAAGVRDVVGAVLLRVAEPDGRTLGMWWYRPVRLIGNGEAKLIELRSSGDITGIAESDGVVEIPPGGAGAGPWVFFPWVM